MLAVGLNFTTLNQAYALATSSMAWQISTDPFTNSTSQHQTEVEPSTFSHGSTVVSVFQSGRFATGGGASDILWATSFNSGQTWQVGTFPGITVYAGGSYARASNAVVVYDQAHHIWQPRYWLQRPTLRTPQAVVQLSSAVPLMGYIGAIPSWSQRVVRLTISIKTGLSVITLQQAHSMVVVMSSGITRTQTTRS